MYCTIDTGVTLDCRVLGCWSWAVYLRKQRNDLMECLLPTCNWKFSFVWFHCQYLIRDFYMTWLSVYHFRFKLYMICSSFCSVHGVKSGMVPVFCSLCWVCLPTLCVWQDKISVILIKTPDRHLVSGKRVHISWTWFQSIFCSSFSTCYYVGVFKSFSGL